MVQLPTAYSLIATSLQSLRERDWLKRLKQFYDLHIIRHVDKYANEPETTLKQF